MQRNIKQRQAGFLHSLFSHAEPLLRWWVSLNDAKTFTSNLSVLLGFLWVRTKRLPTMWLDVKIIDRKWRITPTRRSRASAYAGTTNKELRVAARGFKTFENYRSSISVPLWKA